MYTLEDLQQQNADIASLCDVLAVLLEHPDLRTNPLVCELLQRFREKVWMHLVFEDNPIYSELTRHPDPAFAAIAQQFHDSARAVRRRFGAYVKHWCKPAVEDAEHERFVTESREIIALVRGRLGYESDEVFPLVAAHQEEG